MSDAEGKTDDSDSSPIPLSAEQGLSDVIRRLDRLWDDRPPIHDLYRVEGQEVGGYQLRDVLGYGSFGVVYRAWDPAERRDVALKVPRPEVLLQPEQLRRFKNEATAASELNHPGIVAPHATDFDGPTPHLVSEYVNGPDLGHWLSRAALPTDFESAARFVAKLAEAVQHAHQRGVTHRDIKPGNVLLRPLEGRPQSLDDYQPVLTDFGLAEFASGVGVDTRSSVLIGTPLYMAPEQADPNQPSDSPRSDVYSLGVLLYELLAKRTPYEGRSYVQIVGDIASDRTPDITEHRDDVPNGLRAVLNKVLQPDPLDRYQSPAELAADLNAFLSGAPTEASVPGPMERFWRWSRRPVRLRWAGWYSAAFHTVVFAWMFVVFGLAALVGAIPEGVIGPSVRDIAIVSLLAHLPKVGLGWALARGRLWAYPWSLVTSAVLFVVFVYSTASDAVAFEFNYPNQFAKISSFSMLVMGSAGETVLNLLGWPAWRKARRRASLDAEKS